MCLEMTNDQGNNFSSIYLEKGNMNAHFLFYHICDLRNVKTLNFLKYRLKKNCLHSTVVSNKITE